MSGPPAIKVEGVGKRYQLGAGVQHTLSEKVAGGVRRGVKRVFRIPMREKSASEEFWALRDVSFELERGEKLGLIGANGAGKSTLLKLLAEITAPTEGEITINGRVGSLLEVGTGFNPELTGRENVFLNGAILGLRRNEIAERYNDIVEFSEIEQFMETPVKRYSSGMFVRLAFAVAVHLEPDILLLDEVLSVGDAQFQRKSIDKMQEIVQHDETTLVFVSHSTPTVRKLCDTAIYLDSGRVGAGGPAAKVIDDYLYKLEPIRHGGDAPVTADEQRSGTGEARIIETKLTNDDGKPIDRVRFGEPFTVTLVFDVKEPIPDAIVVIGLGGLDSGRVLTTYSTEHGRPLLSLEPGTLEVAARIEATLLPGEFVIDASIANAAGAQIDYVERLLSLTALNVPIEGSDERYPWDAGNGYARPECDWQIATDAAPDAPAATEIEAEAAPQSAATR